MEEKGKKRKLTLEEKEYILKKLQEFRESHPGKLCIITKKGSYGGQENPELLMVDTDYPVVEIQALNPSLTFDLYAFEEIDLREIAGKPKED